MTHPSPGALAADALSEEVAAHLAVCPICMLERHALRDSLPAATSTWDGPIAPTDAEPESPERFREVGLLGTGGMGEVLEVHDARLDRTVAMKVLRADKADERHAPLFIREARRVARLEHPGIVPVHDAGILPDGRPWFTMKVVRGLTLRAALRSGTLPVRRAVEVVLKAAETVAFAHAAGVVHRDLKPENLMIGTFGEMTVIDWGLAIGPTETARLAGTPGWLAPEVLAGQPADARADVYALGVILFEIVAGRLPYEGPSDRVIAAILAGPPARPHADDRLVGLLDLCESAMDRDPGARPSAAALAAALQAWLDGQLRASEAAKRLVEADECRTRSIALRERAATIRTTANRELAGINTWDPAEKKLGAWALEDEARTLEDDAERADVDFQELLRVALDLDPGNSGALTRRGEYHRGALVDAENRDDRREIVRHRQVLERDGRHAAFLTGTAGLTLRTDPDGAVAVATPLLDQGRRLVEGEPIILGRTPLDVSLPPGRWIVTLSVPGRPPVRYPVRLSRGEAWNAIRPGDREPRPVLIPRGIPGACYIPGGWAPLGGDPEALDALSARRIWVDDFFLQTHPVTVGGYIAFLDDLVASGQEDAAVRFQPVAGPGTAQHPIAALRRDARGRFTAESTEGPWHSDEPVCLVGVDGALAYAAWLGARDGQTWGLPHELAWEKAARGVDGRSWPWGNGFDPAFALMAQSHEGVPRRVAVHAFPWDESPYGVRGLGGNVRDLCGNDYVVEGDVAEGGIVPITGTPSRPVSRGGSWASQIALCRSASRFLSVGPSTSSGIRLATAASPR